MTTNNNVWNDIQNGVKQLYDNDTTIKQDQKEKILEKARQLMNNYKKFNKDIVRFNKFYNINNTTVEGIKYSDIMNIIVKELDKRDKKNTKEEKQKIANLMKNNAPNKDWQLYQIKNKTNSSKGYKNDKQETNVEKERLKKVDNKADGYEQKLKKKELIEKHKGNLDKFFEFSKKPYYKKFRISRIEECVIEKLKKKRAMNNYYHDKNINYYYLLLNDFEKFKKCVENGVIIPTKDYIPQHLIDGSKEQREYLNYSNKKNVPIIRGKLNEDAREDLNITGTNITKINNVQIKIYKKLRKIDPSHWRTKNDSEKKKERQEIFKLFIKVSSSGYKFLNTPRITDFYYDDEEKKYIYLNLNNLTLHETKNNFNDFKKKWENFLNKNDTKFLGFTKKELGENYEITEKKFKEEKKNMKNIKFNNYELIIPASLAAIVSGLLITKNIVNLTKQPSESSNR